MSRAVSVLIVLVVAISISLASSSLPAPDPQSATPSSFASSTGADVTLQGTGFDPGARVGLDQAGLVEISRGTIKALPHDAEIDGDWLYLLGSLWDAGLTIANIADVTEPEIVAEFPTQGWQGVELEVRGNRMVVLDSVGLHVYDITVRSEPVLLSSTPLSFRIPRVFLGERWMVMLDRSRVRLVDLADPSAPRVLEWETSGQAIVVDGDLLYVGTEDGQLETWRLGDAVPSLVSRMDGFDGIGGIIAFRGHLYCTLDYAPERDPNLIIVDVGDPAAPRAVGSMRVGFGRRAFFDGDGEKVFLFEEWKQTVSVWDFSDPASPILIDEMPTSGVMTGSALADGRARTYHWSSIAELDASRAKKRERTTIARPSGLRADILAAHERALYIAHDDGIHVYDTSDPALAIDLGVFETEPFERAHIEGSVLYLLSGLKPIAAYDIGTPLSPVLLSRFGDGGTTFATFGVRAYSCVPSLRSAEIYDVRDPAAPQRLGGVDLGSWTGCNVLATHENALYIGSGWNVRVADVSVPHRARIVGQIEKKGGPGVYVHGDLLVHDGWRGVGVYSLEYPLTPRRLVHRDRMSIGERLVGVAGDVLFFENTAEIHGLDLTDPMSAVAATKVRLGGAKGSVLLGDEFVATGRDRELVSIPRLPLAEDVVVASAEQIDFVVPPGAEPGPYTVRVVNPEYQTGSALNALEVTGMCELGLSLEPAVVLGQGPVPVPFPWTATPSGDPGFLEPGAVHDAWLTMPELPEAVNVEERSLLDRAVTRIELRLTLDGSGAVVTLFDHDIERARALWDSMSSAGRVPLVRDPEGGYAELRLSLQRPPAERVPGHVMSFEDAVLRLEFRDGALVAASARANQPDLLLGIEGETAEGCPGAGEASVATRIAELCAELAGTHPEWVLDCPTAPAGAGFAARGRRGR